MSWPFVFGKTSLYTCSVACVTWPHPSLNSSVATFQRCGVCKCCELLFIWQQYLEAYVRTVTHCVRHRANTLWEAVSLGRSHGLKRPAKEQEGKEKERAEKMHPGSPSVKTKHQRFLLMGGGCFCAFPAVSVVSLNAAECNFWVRATHRAFAGQLWWLFPLWQFKNISRPVWLPCPTARVTVLMPWSVNKSTRAYIVVLLGQSPPFEFQIACTQQIIGIAGGGP